jgi:hypothetical protein
VVFPVRRAARPTPYGHDTLTYGCSRPRTEPPPGGEEETDRQVGTASCDHGIKRWRLHLTQKQVASVTHGLWLHRMTGSAAEANRFAREYGAVHSPARDSGEGPPATRGGAGVGGRG